MKNSRFILTTCALSLFFSLHVVVAHAQEPTPHVKATPVLRVESKPNPLKKNKDKPLSKHQGQKQYVKFYKDAISLIMKAEDDFIASPSRWMPAAAWCQRAIRLLPQLDQAAQGLDRSKLPKANIRKAIDQICIAIMDKALTQLNDKTCKGYRMIRGAFDYFETQDAARWKPRLKKFAACR